MINDLPFNSEKKTMVDKATSFDGDVKSDYSIEVRGIVKGNIVSNSDVFVYNQCLGCANGVNVYINPGGKVNKGINAFNNVVVKQDSVVNGDINCFKIEVYGEVENINAESTVFIGQSAIVHGDINCHELQADENCKIEGTVNIVYKKTNF